MGHKIHEKKPGAPEVWWFAEMSSSSIEKCIGATEIIIIIQFIIVLALHAFKEDISKDRTFVFISC